MLEGLANSDWLQRWLDHGEAETSQSSNCGRHLQLERSKVSPSSSIGRPGLVATMRRDSAFMPMLEFQATKALASPSHTRCDGCITRVLRAHRDAEVHIDLAIIAGCISFAVTIHRRAIRQLLHFGTTWTVLRGLPVGSLSTCSARIFWSL